MALAAEALWHTELIIGKRGHNRLAVEQDTQNNWIQPGAPAQTLAQYLQLQPALQQKYQAFMDALWNDERVPERLLEICRLRLAAIHDCASEWAERRQGIALNGAQLRALEQGGEALCAAQTFTALEQKALKLAEQMPHGHHEIADAQVAALRVELGNAGTIALLNALAFFDVNARLSKVLGVAVGAHAHSHPAEM